MILHRWTKKNPCRTECSLLGLLGGDKGTALQNDQEKKLCLFGKTEEDRELRPKQKCLIGIKASVLFLGKGVSTRKNGWDTPRLKLAGNIALA